MRNAFEVKRLAVLVVCIGFLLGMDTSSISLFLATDYFKDYFKNPSTIQMGLVTSASQVGGFFGCLISGAVIEFLGCKWGLCLCGIIWNVGSFGAIFALEVNSLAFTRLLKGISIGILSVLASFYVMDVFSSNIRGQATALLQVALTTSILLVYFISMLLDGLKRPLSFKLTWGIEVIPAISLLFIAYFLPEAPCWLIKKCNSEKELDRSLDIIKVKNKKRLKEHLSQKYKEVVTTSSLFKSGNWCHLIFGTSVQILIQMSGINVIMYYMVYICDILGFDDDTAFNLTAGPYIVNVLFTVVPFFLMDKFPRKVFVGWSSLLLGTIMLGIGFLIYERQKYVGDVVIRNVVVALCLLFVSIFASSLGCAGFVYTNELLPEDMKSFGLSICISMGWLSGFVLALLAPKMINSIGYWTFLILGSVTMVMSVVIIIWFPETVQQAVIWDKDIVKEKQDIESYSITSEGSCESRSITVRSACPEPDSYHGDVSYEHC